MRNPLDRMEYPVGPPAGFGKRNINVPGASTNHQGIDIGAPKGTPVYAVADGSIVGTTDFGAPGISTLYQIDSETRIRCNHFSERLIDSGEVKQGDIIGLVGSTGASGGNHLHFAVYKLIRGKWEAIDPVPWLKENVNSVASLPDNTTTKLLTEGNEMDFRFKEHNTNGIVYYYNNALDKVRVCSPEEIELLRDTARTWPADPAFQVRELGSSMFKRYASKARYKG